MTEEYFLVWLKSYAQAHPQDIRGRKPWYGCLSDEWKQKNMELVQELLLFAANSQEFPGGSCGLTFFCNGKKYTMGKDKALAREDYPGIPFLGTPHGVYPGMPGSHRGREDPV